MRAWALDHPAPAAEHSLRLVDRHVPEPGPHEILVKVQVCGVCRTDLHLVEGDLAPRGPVSCRVTRSWDTSRPKAARHSGSPRATGSGSHGCARRCGVCRFCLRGDENLCVAPLFTGWDADGGYGEYAVVDERLRLPGPRGVLRSRSRALALRRDHRLPGLAKGIALRPADASASTASGVPPT